MSIGFAARRTQRLLVLISLVTAIAVIGACGGEADDPTVTAIVTQPTSAATRTPTTPDPSSTQAPDSSTFPVTIEHKYGGTTIEEEPGRVVTVGLRDHDTVLALGVKPVAVREWWGNQPYATWPWAQDELGDAKPVVLDSQELDFEQIASLEPDLILGVYSGLTDEEYARLSRIAPTVAQSGDYPDWGTPWQTETQVIGRALGQEQRALDLIAGIEERFAEVRAQHPEFNGKTAAVASTWGEGAYWLYGTQDARGQFLTALGFEIPADVADMVPATEFGANVSDERVDLLNLDALVWFTSSANDAPLDSPLYKNLQVAEEGRDIQLPETESSLVGAFSFSTVLSLPYAIEELVPQLAAAVDGDPATVATDAARPAFPVTVEHKYGSITIAEEPERVVSLGYNEQDTLLALGVKPVAVRYWFGDEPHAVFPWAQDELGDAEPEVLNMPFGELDYEKIASLDPDLINAVYSGITREEYDRLSQIAPVVAQSGEHIDFGMPWQESTTLIGKSLGLEAEAQAMVEELEARLEATRQSHPDWQGRSVAVVAPRSDGQVGIFASGDLRSQFFESLGFQVPADFDEIAGDSFFANVSRERADLLDQDVVIFHQLSYLEGGREAVESDSLWSKLNALKEDRAIFLDYEADSAFSFNSVLSIDHFFELIVPRLEAALDGDPATEANP